MLEAARRSDIVVYTAQVEFEREPVVMARLCDALASVIYLAGPDAGYISGSVMDVSGGVLS